MSLVESNGNVSIVATNLAMLDAEDIDGRALAALLGVEPPASWPPIYNDQDTRDWIRGMIERNPGEPGYGSWYIVANGCLVGNAGFKGPPDADGTVEIGYSVIESEQRKGYGSSAIGLLVAYAFRDPRVTAVTAETIRNWSPRRPCWRALVSLSSAARPTTSSAKSCVIRSRASCELSVGCSFEAVRGDWSYHTTGIQERPE